MTIHKVLQLRAVDREFIGQEHAGVAALFDAVCRQTRNQFGHNKIRYDPSTGLLHDDRGASESFLLFSIDYLSAVRALAFTTEVLCAITEDQAGILGGPI